MVRGDSGAPFSPRDVGGLVVGISVLALTRFQQGSESQRSYLMFEPLIMVTGPTTRSITNSGVN
jgi:hypothetical protein